MPFVAVVAANCVNIPVMRQRELIDGIMVTDQEGNDLVKSKVSGQYKYRSLMSKIISGGSKGGHFSGYPLKDFHSHSYNA